MLSSARRRSPASLVIWLLIGAPVRSPAATFSAAPAASVIRSLSRLVGKKMTMEMSAMPTTATPAVSAVLLQIGPVTVDSATATTTVQPSAPTGADAKKDRPPVARSSSSWITSFSRSLTSSPSISAHSVSSICLVRQVSGLFRNGRRVPSLVTTIRPCADTT